MRRLLLLLLTFLLPLQLLAATVSDVSAQRNQREPVSWPSVAVAADASGQGIAIMQLPGLQKLQDPQALQDLQDLQERAADAATAGGVPSDDEDGDAPVLQADVEDHTLPARLATPGLSWHPFPHAFTAPLHWPSFVHDQLRPPPLA